MAACPIVMTMITFQKQLTEVSLGLKPTSRRTVPLVSPTNYVLSFQDAIEQLISPAAQVGGDDKPEAVHPTDNVGQTKRSWWIWRRSQDAVPSQVNNADKKHQNSAALGKDEKGYILLDQPQFLPS